MIPEGRRLAAVALSVLGLLLTTLSPAHAEAAPVTSTTSAPVRILLFGDSITCGFNGDYTWRYRLAREFSRQHTPVDFVGSLHSPYVAPGYSTSTYADPGFDSDFFARVGDQLLRMRERVGEELASDDPDLVVLEGGVNDLIVGTDVGTAIAYLRDWIDAARAAKPNLRIVLSPVLPVDRPDFPGINDRIEQFDQLEAAVAVEESTAISPITVADTARGWEPASHLYTVDGIHPAPTGETLIAQRIAEHLHALGVLPDSPDAFRRLAWSRTARPQVHRAGRRITITWPHENTTGADVYTHRRGRSVYRYVSGGRLSARITRRTTYTIRLRLRRSRVWGPWGAAVTVRVG